jgi:hypothetical protein
MVKGLIDQKIQVDVSHFRIRIWHAAYKLAADELFKGFL